MANFTLREPPSVSGRAERDIEEIYSWAAELYENLWLLNFVSAQKKKNQKKEEKNQ